MEILSSRQLADDRRLLQDADQPQLCTNFEVVRVSLVKPSKPTKERHLMFMSGVDQMLRLAAPNRTLLLYRTDKDIKDAMEALRRGIAAALVHYYPMAGRLVKVEEEDGRLYIDCNDAGVELIQAQAAHHLSFAELELNHFGMRRLFSQLVPMQDCKGSDLLAHPVASFQVTAFKGGLTVGIAAFHSVVDGHAMWDFVRAVARCCHNEPLPGYPLHARILLKPEVFMMGTRHPVVLQGGRPISSLAIQDLTKKEDVIEAPYHGCMDTIQERNIERKEEEPHKVIHFSEEMLEILKKACVDSTSEAETTKRGFFVSTYQVLVAYLWKRLTMARESVLVAAAGDTATNSGHRTEFRLLVDIRNRISPPLTSTFFGNAVVGVPTPCTTREIIDESLGDTTTRIRHGLEQLDDMCIKKLMIAREKADDHLRTLMGLSGVQLMVVRNGSKFPVYEGSNFGWGEPEAVRSPWNQEEGGFTLYPGKKAKSVDVIGAFKPKTFDQFFSFSLYPNDPLFGSHPWL